MIIEEKLDRLYEKALENTEMTTKQLNEIGFNSKDINELIEDGTIERIKRGQYSFKSIEKLLFYGKKLISKKEYDKSTACFEKCYELDSNNLGACFQLFFKNIQIENYEKAFELYEKLSQSKNKYYNNDLNYYLYLLSIITNIPEKYKEYAKYINIENIRVLPTDKRYEDIPLQNKIRIAALQRKFPFALKQLKELTEKHGGSTTQDVITRTLLYQAARTETISKDAILNLIREKKYNEVINYLLDTQKRHKLSLFEDYILELANQIIEIQETSEIPKIKEDNITILDDAIKAKDYELALDLCKEHDEKYNIRNDNSITILLTDICELIKKIKKEQKQEKGNYELILSYLLNNDIENALYNLNIHMNKIGKEGYTYLIEDLIKISKLDNDCAYTKPMVALTLITNDKFEFDISKYIRDFYIELSKKNYEKARIYVDIVSKANKIENNIIVTDNLYKILDLSENLTQQEQIEETEIKESKEPETIEPEKIEIIDIKPEEVTVDIIKNEEEKLISKKYNEIKQKGIIILKKIKPERIDKLFEVIDKYDDIVGYIINFEGNRHVVLRYYVPSKETLKNASKTIREVNQAYSNNDYKLCIEKFTELIKGIPNPKSSIYGKLGMSYLRTNKKNTAIDFLIIASEQAKTEKNQIDYTDLIYALKGQIKEEDTKISVEVKESEFEEDNINNYYGIDDFDDVNKYIHLSGLDVETACKSLNKTPEQTDIIKLIYARQYYIQGDIDRGDLFIKSVENSKEKTDLVIKLLDKIRTNKKIYESKENDMQYSLKIVPKNNKNQN